MSGSPQQSSPSPLIKQFTIAFEGNALGYVLYGIYVAVAITNLVLLRDKKKILFAFTLFQLIVTTLYNAIQLYNTPQEFLSLYNLAGGNATASVLSPWSNVLIGVAYVVNTWCSDAFLVYRCYVVMMGNKHVVAFPVLLYLAVVGASIAYLKFTLDPSATYSTAAVRTSALSYWSFSVALNVVASCIIAIFSASPQQGSFYLAYMAMTLESALLYTAFGIAGLVVLALNSAPLESVFFTILGPIQVLAPALIVNRIARGVSFESDSSMSISSSLRYAAPSHIRSTTDEDISLGTHTIRASCDRGSKMAGRLHDDLYLHNTKSTV
ncbi:hypothetical protein V8E55_008165 [Tylopilus felleus]